MKLQRIVIASIFALSLALTACGGGDPGATCYNNDECASGLACVPVAVCGGEGDCPGICLQPCSSDEECPAGQMCGGSVGSDGEYCRASVTP